MKRGLGESTAHSILHRLFRKAEISYNVSSALGPMIGLLFTSQFIGADGVTVKGNGGGYVPPRMPRGDGMLLVPPKEGFHFSAVRTEECGLSENRGREWINLVLRGRIHGLRN